MKALFIIISFLMFINAKGQVTDPGGWKIYYDKEFYFSLSYPPNWEFHQDTIGTKCIIYAPDYPGAKYRANISADAFALPAGGEKVTVSQFAETSFGVFRQHMQDCRVMITKDVSHDGIPQFLVVANGIVNGKYVYVKQLYCLYQQVAYVINYIGEAGIKDPYAIAAGDIFSSFKPLKTISR